jgi:SAM-dependent methyltransferase
MNPPLLCASCQGTLDDRDSCQRCGWVAPRAHGVYRFSPDAYATSFGLQWQEFARTQLDSANGTNITEERFASITGWTPEMVVGKSVLDVGCGAGRFTEVAIKWGAQVTAVDLSAAVYAARANVASSDRARFVQADARNLPLPKHSFDYVFSIGVAQHTPDPLEFVGAVARMVAPGGRLALWIYERRLASMLRPKYLLRPLTRRLPHSWNRRLVGALVEVFFPVAEHLSRAPSVLRGVATRALPIAAYVGELPLSRAAQKEWSRLDTLDWYSPRYDLPQRFEPVAAVLQGARAREVVRRPVPGLTVCATF